MAFHFVLYLILSLSNLPLLEYIGSSNCPQLQGRNSYSQPGTKDNEHGLVTQQPTTCQEMRTEALRSAVKSGSLPASALDEDGENKSDNIPSNKNNKRESTQYSYSLFHLIFFLATTWVATFLTQNLDPDAVNDFALVSRTYGLVGSGLLVRGCVTISTCGS